MGGVHSESPRGLDRTGRLRGQSAASACQLASATRNAGGAVRGGPSSAARSASVWPVRSRNAGDVHRLRQVARYACVQARRLQAAERGCHGLGGLRLQEKIVDAFLAAPAPASVDVTLAALHETEDACQRERHQRELPVERARYEAERAERQFTRVEPENRLVACSVERVWEERLRDLAQCQDELAGFRPRRPTPLSEDDADWLRRAGSEGHPASANNDPSRPKRPAPVPAK